MARKRKTYADLTAELSNLLENSLMSGIDVPVSILLAEVRLLLDHPASERQAFIMDEFVPLMAKWKLRLHRKSDE